MKLDVGEAEIIGVVSMESQAQGYLQKFWAKECFKCNVD